MSKIATKAIITNPDGSLFYREEHEWTNLTPEELAWFKGKLEHLQGFGKKLLAEHSHGQHGKGGKGDDANLKAVLSAAIDGAAMGPDVVLTGVPRSGLSKFEREVQKLGSELIAMSEAKHGC